MREPQAGDHDTSGDWSVVDPPRRLTFTWSWDDHDSERQLIELQFTEHRPSDDGTHDEPWHRNPGAAGLPVAGLGSPP